MHIMSKLKTTQVVSLIPIHSDVCAIKVMGDEVSL